MGNRTGGKDLVQHAIPRIELMAPGKLYGWSHTVRKGVDKSGGVDPAVSVLVISMFHVVCRQQHRQSPAAGSILCIRIMILEKRVAACLGGNET